jgi:hypothetical protein
MTKRLCEIGAGPFAPENLNGTEGDPIENMRGLCRLEGIDFDSGQFFILARDQRRELLKEAIHRWEQWKLEGRMTGVSAFLLEEGIL